MSKDYSEEQFLERYTLIKDIVTVGKSPVDFPTAYILGGQPGSGKSRLQKLILKQDNNTIVINADAYRVYHPYFTDFQSEFGDRSPEYTQPFINHVTEKLISDLSDEHYNLIVEGTLRSADVPIATCQLMKNKGYHVKLYIMAVKPEISYESTILRYEYALSKGEIPRATEKRHHDMVVSSLVENIKMIEERGAFDTIYLFTRFGNCVYDSNGTNTTASCVEQGVLYGKWNKMEFNELQRIISEVNELKALRKSADMNNYKQRTHTVLRKVYSQLTKGYIR